MLGSIPLQHTIWNFILFRSEKENSYFLTVGKRIGDLWIITEGLKPNARIVIDALPKVAEGDTLKSNETEFKSKTTKLKE